MDDSNKLTISDFNSPIKPTWCPGCGDYTILASIKKALVELDIAPSEVVLVFDIGCNSNMADKINANFFKGLHGRVLPLASGIKLGNKDLTVIAIGGDGGTFSEGMLHFIHTFRSNYDITLLLHNNCDFGLTTGQATPTTPTGQQMNSSPYGVVETRFNPIQTALSINPSFIARSSSIDPIQLTDLLKQAIKHKGFSYLEVLQTCPTYNKFFTIDFYRNHIAKVDDLDFYDPTDIAKAREITSYEFENQNQKIYTGLIYINNQVKEFTDRITHLDNLDRPLARQVRKQDISKFYDEFI